MRARDEAGKASSGWLLGVVVDERVAPMDQPGLADQFLLLSDLPQEIENADLLASETPDVSYVADLFPGSGTLLRAIETGERLQTRHALDLYLGSFQRIAAQILHQTGDAPCSACQNGGDREQKRLHCISSSICRLRRSSCCASRSSVASPSAWV